MSTPTSIPDGAEVQVQANRNPLSKIICVGDVHGQWADTDEAALRALNPDMVLFVGDYGNEDVQVTSRIAAFAASSTFHVATVFGNHDAHYTASSSRRLKRYRKESPDESTDSQDSNSSTLCRVRQQMNLLREFDVSYRNAPMDNLSLSVIGGRPFSIGGPNWKHAQFYRSYINVSSLVQSTSKLVEAALQSRFQTLIFLSHSGPTGLGALPEDPCGKDWGSEPGGDYGDADLREAIQTARAKGFHVPLIVFGHMHKSLQGGFGQRTMMKTEIDSNLRKTVMLNVAVVPRHKTADPKSKPNGEPPLLHNFHIVQLRPHTGVEKVEEAWVTSNGNIFESLTIYDENDPSTFNNISIKARHTTKSGSLTYSS